nr:cyclic nucleotide-gated ion channel 1-like [Ziziphus jujuba var. spinosa]
MDESFAVATITRKLWPYSILADVLAVLPLTQVGIAYLFFKRSLWRSFVNFLLVCQYTIRIVRMHLAFSELKRTPKALGPKAKGALNLFLYVTSSHTACWRNACRKLNIKACVRANFECTDRQRANPAFLNAYCPVDPQNPKIFDFGIFIDAVGILGPVEFPKKFFHSYWWGLQNLRYVGRWLPQDSGMRRKFPFDLKRIIRQCVEWKLEYSKDVNLQTVLCVLPLKYKDALKEHFCLATLKKLPMLQHISEQMLKRIIDHVEPVMYNPNSYIIREGEPLDFMLFITQGTAWSFTANNYRSFTSFTRLKKGDCYGEELVQWTSTFASFLDFPMSHSNVKSHTKVEAFILNASDLMNFVSTNWSHFTRNKRLDLTRSNLERLDSAALQSVRNVRESYRRRRHSYYPRRLKSQRSSVANRATF